MILTVQGVTFHYPSRPVLEQISFEVAKGELLAVLGTNGTGKTTLLKCLDRILKPAAGVVLIDDQPIAALSRNALAQRIGYVEQHRPDSRASVFNTVLLGRKPYIQWDITQNDMNIAAQALDTLGLGGYALRFLDELSGGELQKVIIARALAQQPELLLMDEPTNSLDLKNQLEVLSLVRQITRQRRIAAVVAMHDLNLALRFADRFLLLKDRRIFAAGGAEVMTPANIESVYAVPVAVTSHNGNPFVIPL
jgi:iron complex transport system ATP-binding protein